VNVVKRETFIGIYAPPFLEVQLVIPPVMMNTRSACANTYMSNKNSKSVVRDNKATSKQAT
jgi:hypothetical protein